MRLLREPQGERAARGSPDHDNALADHAANLEGVAGKGVVDDVEELSVANKYRQDLKIRCSSVYQTTVNLSGGNQQKVLVGRWLLTNPSILILDEPTRGIDVGAKAEIHRLVSELAGQGVAILMISSEMPEVLGMSDRVAVMHEGRITGILDRQDANQVSVMDLAAK